MLPKGSPLRPKALYNVISSHSNANSRLELSRWRPSSTAIQTTAITVYSGSQLSLIKSARARMSSRHRLLVIAPYPAPLGLKDLVRGWRKEAERNIVNLIMVKNEDGSNFLLDEPPHIDLAFTVFNKVSICRLLLDCKDFIHDLILHHYFLFVQGIWGGEYNLPMQASAQLSNNLTLQCPQIGDLNSLKWMEASDLDKTGIAVKVRYFYVYIVSKI